MTERQIDFARHALGFPNKKNTSYRNHFCIGKGGDGYEDWQDLVSQGLAIQRNGPHWGGDSMFYLTLKAALMVRGPKEHISREDAEGMRKMESYFAAETEEGPGSAPPKQWQPQDAEAETAQQHASANAAQVKMLEDEARS